MADETPEETIARLTTTINELNDKTAAYDVHIAELQTQLAGDPAIITELTAQRDAAIADNVNLRTSLAAYLQGTDGGKAAIAEFNLMLWRNQLAICQQQVAALTTPAS